MVKKTQNKIDAKLKITKDPLSKILHLIFFLSSFKVVHSQLIKLFMQFPYLLMSNKKEPYFQYNLDRFQ